MTTNAFKINGVQLSLQPSDHHWSSRSEFGRDGAGHNVYPAVREYELRWDFMTASEFYELVNNYNSFASGTVVVDLPEWGVSTYQFKAYSGCIMDEPQFGEFFENYYGQISLLISSVRT
jgi:hypothetical protein